MENLFYGKPELPELPVFGLRILMPTLAKEYRYEGLSGETYPDRKKGAHRGVFTEKPIMTPYLVPQECVFMERQEALEELIVGEPM